jgi:hypothetical protein
VTYTQNYTITANDLSKYTNGTFTNHATLTYKYKSTYGQGSYDASASASVSCKINGIVSYSWMDGLPEGLTEDSTNYPLPDEAIAEYESLVTVESYDGLRTYDEVNESGRITGTWTFMGWKYNGAYCKADSTVTMPTNDSIEFVGIWEYKAAPTYSVSYDWGEVAPEDATLPTDGSEYLSGESYEVDGEYDEDTTIDDGVLIWSFSGWTLDNNIVIGSKEIENEDVTLKGEWSATNKYTSLTITKSGCSSLDANQSFLFYVKGKVDNKDLNLNVHGNGSITIDGLEVGETYTIRENHDWSWRYDQSRWAFTTGDDANKKSGTGDDEIVITLSETGNQLTVTNTRNKTSWLDGNTYNVNKFTGTTTNTTD